MLLWIPWWNNFSTLILCILLNHKVDIGVSILLLSSFNVGCHGTIQRFRDCVFPQMFANTLLWSWPIMYLLTFVKALLLSVQLDHRYLVEFNNLHWREPLGFHFKFCFQFVISALRLSNYSLCANQGHNLWRAPLKI
jgi:hypothetical protein